MRIYHETRRYLLGYQKRSPGLMYCGLQSLGFDHGTRYLRSFSRVYRLLDTTKAGRSGRQSHLA